MERAEIERIIAEHRAAGEQVPQLRYVKTPEQIAGIRASAVINTGVLDEVAARIGPGVSTQDVDDWVKEYTESHGAICAPYHYEGYPKHVCVSIDDVVCHGIPSPRTILKEGMIVNVDVSTIYNGYYSDASRMFIIGETTAKKKKLVDVTKECLDLGLAEVKPWGHLGDVGYVIEQHAEANGFKVVRAFGGHGVGLEFHEDPFVAHYGKRGKGCLIVPGMVFTIEPMINMRKSAVWVSPIDDWTVFTKDKLPSAQWEYTVAVFDDHAEVLSW
jgi:methionyl aminopeptidase